jgi:hypothetical protein
MKCEDVRMRLAAYRRSEWSAEEQHAVSEHLAGCAACRRWESDARHVGDQLREMPTLVPPASLRANVFAAIRREELAAATHAAETAKPAEARVPKPAAPILIPRPSVRTVRPAVVAAAGRLGEVALGNMRPTRVIFGRQTAIATIAALFLIMFTARLLPLNQVGGIASGNNALKITQAQPPAFTISADPRFPKVTSVFANNNQILYIGQDANGQSMLFAYNRSASQFQELLAQPTSDTLTLLALSDQLLVWQDRSNASWSLQATPLVNGFVLPLSGAALTLATNGASFADAALAQINAVWADGASVLFSAVNTHGATLLGRADDTPNAPLNETIVAEATPGDTFILPYLDGTTAYWVDEKTAADGSQQGTLWRKADEQAATSLGITANTFGPVAANGHVAWFQQSAPTSASTVINGSIMHPLIGGIVVRTDGGSATQTISAAPVNITDVWRGTGYILWRDALGLHVYHVDSGDRVDNSSLPVLGAFDTIGLSATAMTWATGTMQGNLVTPSTISVFQLG